MLSNIIDTEFVHDTLSLIDDSTRLSDIVEKLRIPDEERALGEIALRFESWVSKEFGLSKIDQKTVWKITKTRDLSSLPSFISILKKVKARLPSGVTFDAYVLCNVLFDMKQPRLPSAYMVTLNDLQTKTGLEQLIDKYLENEDNLVEKAILKVLCNEAIKDDKKVIKKIRSIYDI